MDVKACLSYAGVLFGALLLCACSTQPLTWQQRRLEQPTEAELKWERSGRVMIYEGMKDREVERAMSHHFDRIQGMMFINTIVTDEDGNPLIDPETGVVLTEKDGCD